MVSVKVKGRPRDLSGGNQGDERKRTDEEASKHSTDGVNTGVWELPRDKPGGDLLTDQAASGVEAA